MSGTLDLLDYKKCMQFWIDVPKIMQCESWQLNKINFGWIKLENKTTFGFRLMVYKRPLLFADFLSVNSLIHISKLVQNDNLLFKNGFFIYEFRIRGSKWRNISTANNEGNLYYYNWKSHIRPIWELIVVLVNYPQHSVNLLLLNYTKMSFTEIL